MQLSVPDILDLLREGEIELLGLHPAASNYTFVATIARAGMRALAIYKPQRGEIPLWDFPEGTLYQRELAAYAVSEALGWSFVPPTVVREGPEGIGSLQLFIDHEEAEHYFTLMPEHSDVFRRAAAFDIVINNADRKSGHCLLEKGTGRIFFVDHGVCFHAEPKLRTVIWDFAGEDLPADVAERLEAMDLSGLRDLLTEHEVEAARARRDALLRDGVYPAPPEDRRSFPWPPV